MGKRGCQEPPKEMQGEQDRTGDPSLDPGQALFALWPDPSSLWDEPLSKHVHKDRR